MPGTRRKQRLKEKISLKLIYSPFLRLVIFNKWFRAAFLFLAGGALFLSLYLPKIWTVSPDDFLPVVKVSGLDMAQAWSLRRAARAAEGAGDFKKANYSWQAAMVNNPADRRAIRGFLRNAVKMAAPDQRTLGVAYGLTSWLLRLDQTNSADLELCSQVFSKFQWHEVMAHTFGAIPDLPPGARAAYMKALFQLGRMEEFREEYEEHGPGEDAELPLYFAAWRAGWGSGPESTADLKRLEEAAEKGDPRVARLYMLVCAKRGRTEGYLESLERLARVNEASVLDHAGYWRLLAAENRKEEAAELARAYSRPPGNPRELTRLADIYYQLGLREACLEILGRHASQFSYSPEVWLTYAAVLEREEEWEQLREIALRIRGSSGIEQLLAGYGYYLEGRAHLALGRTAPADYAFKKAAEASYDLAAIGFLVAQGMDGHSRHEPAYAVLKKLEQALGGQAAYWEARFENATRRKDAAEVLAAATRLHELKPEDVMARNRYAAALMINRVRPIESIKLTLQLVAAYPNSPTANINHAFALLLNGRSEEARGLLERMKTEFLDPVESSAYHLALFEACLKERDYEAAWSASEKILTSQLYPAQARWFEEKRAELPPRLTAAL